MISTTYNAQPVWILPYAPDWGDAVGASFELLTESDTGLSNREHRRAMSATLRTTLKYSATLFPEESPAFLAALAADDNRPVLCPFWPAETIFTERTAAAVAGGLRVWYEPTWSSYVITPDAATPPTGYSADARTAPLLWCRWGKLPASEALTGGGHLAITFELVEAGDAAYALTPRAVALGFGPDVAGAATPLLPDSIIHWSKPSGGAEIHVERERIGYGRAESEDYVAQTPRLTQKLAVRCFGADEIAKILRLFADRRGSVGSWWCPAYHSTDTADRMLVRFKTAKLAISWKTPTSADASIEVIAVPTEAVAPSDETIGTTIGDLGAPFWLYVVTDGDLTWRYTSYESAIDAGALGAFDPRPIQQGARTSELNLERHDMELTVGWWEGSPFERIKLDRLAPKLTVQVYRGRIAAPAAAALIFTGTVTGPRFEGSKCTCTLSGMSALFDGKGPVAVTSPRCWAPLYSAPCGLIEAALDSPAQLAASGAGALMLEPVGGGGWPATVADHYRYGYAERTLADGSKRRHRIVGSEVVVTDGYVSPLRTGLVDWWDFPEIGEVPRYGQANGTELTNANAASIPGNIPTPLRRRGPGVGGPSSTNSLISAAGIIAPSPSGISLAMWVRLVPGVAGTTLLLAYGETAIYRTSGAYRMVSTGGIPTPWLTPDDPDGWKLIVAIVDAAGDRLTLYMSGASVGTARVSTYPIGSLTSKLSVFNQSGGTQEDAVDQVIVWDRALSIEDCDALYNYGLGVTYPDTATAGDQLVVRTLGALNPAPAAYPEAGWRLVPGCDKSFGRCKALGNSANFRGFPHFPKSNPALIPIKQETPAGGKK